MSVNEFRKGIYKYGDVDVILENCQILFVIREYLLVDTSCQGSMG